jgi:1-deoxy-D-xylulose-5-phosphate synthase
MNHIGAMVVNASTIKPLDDEMLKRLNKIPVITMEEHVLAAGFGSAIAEHCIIAHQNQPLMMLGIPDKIVGHGSRDDLMASLGLVPGQMAARIKTALNGLGKAAP